MKKRLYFAGPLFSQAEVIYNQHLAERLERVGYEVFLPQRDGVEASKPPYDTMTKDGRRRVMFELDRDKISTSDVFLFILDGRVPDEGACVELGMAYVYKTLRHNNRLLVGLHTDLRAAFLGGELNPMIRVPLDIIFENEQELLEYLKTNAGKS